MRIFGRSLLPSVPNLGTKIVSLLNADEIFQAQREVIESTRPGKNLYICHYSLPLVKEGPPVGTVASSAQRQILPLLEEQVRKRQVKAFVVADNSTAGANEAGGIRRNEQTIDYLHEASVFVLSYPTRLVSINHTKFISNGEHSVVTSANLSSHSADSPDDNTGFLLAGAAVHNGIVHCFLPQWRLAAREDQRGWANSYPVLRVDGELLLDEKVSWLNTAPREETSDNLDRTEIFEAYRKVIQYAASGPPNGYLYFGHFDLSNLDLLRHVLYAHHANPTLDIRFIIDPNQYLEGLKVGSHDTRVVAYQEVKEAGIPLRFARVKQHPNGSTDPQRFHNKYAVHRVFIVNGSGNFSNHSLNGNNPIAVGIIQSIKKSLSGSASDNAQGVRHSQKLHNREVDVLVEDQGSAEALKEKFLNDWIYNSCDDPLAATGEGINSAGAKP